MQRVLCFLCVQSVHVCMHATQTLTCLPVICFSVGRISSCVSTHRDFNGSSLPYSFIFQLLKEQMKIHPKKIATVKFSVYFVLLMKSVVGLCIICLVKMKPLKSGHLEHKKGIEMFLLQEVYLELGARASNPISHHTAEGRPMGYPCLL